MDLLVVALAVLVGLSLGLMGGGGSILTVPLLVYVAGQEPKVAVATSLLVVTATSAAAAVPHARAGRVQWRTGGLFGVAGMTGAFAGGRIGSGIDGTVLLLLFALMMLVTSGAMLLSDGPSDDDGHDLRVWRVLLDGAVVGLVTGLVGAGGGFLVVPALVLLGGVPMRTAVGTSLVVITLKSASGFLGYATSVDVPWGLALGVTAAAVCGSVVGARLVDRVPADRLRTWFGWFVLVMALVVVAQEGPDLVRGPVGAAVAIAIVTAMVVAVRRRDAADADDARGAGEDRPDEDAPNEDAPNVTQGVEAVSGSP